jgi:hypothetical protein
MMKEAHDNNKAAMLTIIIIDGQLAFDRQIFEGSHLTSFHSLTGPTASKLILNRA